LGLAHPSIPCQCLEAHRLEHMARGAEVVSEPASAALGPGPWRQTGVVREPPVGEVGRYLAEVAMWMELVEVAGTYERISDGGPIAAVLTGSEEPFSPRDLCCV
jgi:hypothetical protein